MLLVPIPYGELADRIVILELKCERITDEARRSEALRYRDALLSRWREAMLPSLVDLPEYAELIEVNAALWDIEDDLRQREREGRFDDGFVALARSVYLTNDRRAKLKASVDRSLGSPLSEPKWHPVTDRDV